MNIPNEETRMDNPEKLATLGSQDIGQGQTKNTTQKNKKMSNTDPPNPSGEPICSHNDDYTCFVLDDNVGFYSAH